MNPELKKAGANHFVLSGELNMMTVPDVANRAVSEFAGLSGEVSIDLSGVSRADSAGLALLVDWLRLARRAQFTIRFQHLPEQLLQIARVSELHDVLPIET